jgi:hypothetical protein
MFFLFSVVFTPPPPGHYGSVKLRARTLELPIGRKQGVY